jgi:hypothetical protein
MVCIELSWLGKSDTIAAMAFEADKTELRGFAPIGILEQWNSGMMGLKKTEFKAHIPSFQVAYRRKWPQKSS